MQRSQMAKLEWPTLMLLVACYGLWLGSTLAFQFMAMHFGLVAAILMLFALTSLVTAFHTSLQHEVVHGHPTPWPLVNEALVFPSLILVYPFRRYRALHLKHHNDNQLTDPYEDPESYFWPEDEQTKIGPVKLFLLGLNNTFVGRMVLGPWLGLWGFYRTEFQRIKINEPGVRKAWILHLVGCGLVIAWLFVVCNVPLLVYVLAVCYPAVSWILVRSFAEHQAAERVSRRTAIVEAHPFFGLLFLNNNLHVVHHTKPDAAWYELPKIYERQRDHYLGMNGGYKFDGYGEVVRRYAFRKKQPVFHPFLHRKP